VKYSFLYSILMNERWHELNLVKRVNTVLIIEGGCTKKVSNIIHKLVCLFLCVLYSHCGSVINLYIEYNICGCSCLQQSLTELLLLFGCLVSLVSH